METFETLDVRIKSKKEYSPPCIGEDTPHSKICELDIEPLAESSFQKMIYQLFSSGFETIHYEKDRKDYEKFKNSNIGNVIRVVYSPIGKYVNKEVPWERVNSKIFSIIKGNYVTSGGSYACHPADSAPVKSIENLTQNWKIE